MKDIIIRAAKLNDYMGIQEINKKVLGYEYDLNFTKSNLEYILSCPFYKIFIAENKEKIVGYIHASNYDNTYMKKLKNVMAVAVDLNMQKKGIGRLLLNRVEQWAKEDDCFGIRLVSGENRKQAHIFYEHCGYIRRKNQINFIKWF